MLERALVPALQSSWAFVVGLKAKKHGMHGIWRCTFICPHFLWFFEFSFCKPW